MAKRFNNSDRLSFFPVQNPGLEKFYQAQKKVTWTAQEIDYSDDRNHAKDLDKNTYSYITHLLFLFAQLDGIVSENIIDNFKKETGALAKECIWACTQFATAELTHNETYSLLIKAFVQDPIEQEKGLDSINNYPAIGDIAEWAMQWMDTSLPLAERVVAFACIEGIIFSSAFAGIYWLKRLNKVHGLTKANEWIARDEAIHTEYGIALYHHMTGIWKSFPALTEERIFEIIRSAVAVTEKFTRTAMNAHLVGLDADDMVQYVKCTADRLCVSLGYSSIYTASNPFDWMMVIALPNKSNFFETVTTEYARPGDKEAEIDFDAGWD